MSALAIDKSAFDALTPTRREGLRAKAARVRLGDPAPYSDGATVWLVFDSPLIKGGAEWVAEAEARGYGDRVQVHPYGVPGGWEAVDGS